MYLPRPRKKGLGRGILGKVYSTPILGLETCQRLNLIKRVEVLNCDNVDFIPTDHDVFGEIGCLPDEYYIEINENANPVIHPPRRVPYALMNKLKSELDRMKQLDIIEEVDEPTEWVSSLVRKGRWKTVHLSGPI